MNPGPTRTQMRARAVPGEDPMTLKTPEDMFVELTMPSCEFQGEYINADVLLKERRTK